MSIKVMSDIWESAGADGSYLLVLLAMADFANDKGSGIYPSMQTLAAKTRMSESQTRRIVQDLIENDIVELVQAGGWQGGRNTPNHYRIILDNIGRKVTRKKGGDKRKPRGGSRLTGGIKLTPPSASDTTVVAPVTPRGGSASATTVVAPVTPDPSIEPSYKEPSGNRHSSPAAHEPSPQQKMFGAVCECVGYDPRTLTDRDKKQVAQTVGILAKAEYTVADVRRFMTDVWFNDWRWQKSQQLPTLTQLRTEIGKLHTVIPPEHLPGRKQSKGSEAVDRYFNRVDIDLQEIEL